MIVQPLPDEQATLTLRHRVQVVHATTRRPIAFDAEVVPAPPARWVVVLRGSEVLVSAWQDAPDPPAPLSVELRVHDRELAARLNVPAPDPQSGEVAPDAAVALDAAEITHEFDPAPAVLQIELVEPDGGPSSGRTVEARGASGALVALAENGATGTYRSPETVWTVDFHPFELLVDGSPLRRVAIDPTRRTTALRLVDPT